MSTTVRAAGVAVDELEVAAYTVPTDQPEADGTLAWDSTTIVVVHAHGGGEVGVGYTYSDVSSGEAGRVQAGRDRDRSRRVRAAGRLGGDGGADPQPVGRPGITSMAIAAVDVALWDLKARTLGLPLCKLLGMAHDRVAVYGSGGFTAYSPQRLAEQLAGWVEQGHPAGEDEGGLGARPGPRAREGGPRGNRPGRAVFPRRQRGVFA